MNIQLISDMHFEFHPHGDHGSKFINDLQIDAEILVIAGDMCPVLDKTQIWSNAMKQLLERVPYIIYITGNHDYFHSSIRNVDDYLNDFDSKNQGFHFLKNKRITIENKHFAGTTLWYKNVNQGMLSCDHRLISDSLTIFDENKQALQFIKYETYQDDIIITHHLPTHKSIAKQFRGSDLNMFFLCDCEDLIIEIKPRLWLHGHTHTACDYTFGDTRIVCNPYGYPHEKNTNFNKSKILEV